MRTTQKKLLSLKEQISDITKSLTFISLEIDKLIEEEENDVNESPTVIEQVSPEVIEQIKEKVIEDLKSPSPQPSRRLYTTPSKDNSQFNRPSAKDSTNSSNPFLPGDRVIITNNYKGLKGTEGTVDYVHGKYTYITDNKGRQHKKESTNLRRIL